MPVTVHSIRCRQLRGQASEQTPDISQIHSRFSAKKTTQVTHPHKKYNQYVVSSYCKRRQRSPTIRADRTHGLLQTSLRRARSCRPFGWPGVRRYRSERKECGKKMLGWTGADDEERKFCCEWDGDGEERISFLSMKKKLQLAQLAHTYHVCAFAVLSTHIASAGSIAFAVWLSSDAKVPLRGLLTFFQEVQTTSQVNRDLCHLGRRTKVYFGVNMSIFWYLLKVFFDAEKLPAGHNALCLES